VEADEGNFVYKLRRRVKIGDLCDFSSLDRRRKDCLREVKKNRLLAPDIYLGVATATLRNQVMVFESQAGEVVDWAVKMRRFREENKMDNLLSQGKVTKENILELAEVIARFHQRLLVPKKAAEYGSFDNVKRIWDENFEQGKELLGTAAIDKETIMRTQKRIERYLGTNRSLFAMRIKEGRVLNCHGDFHTGNVVIEEKVKPFDALEFNDAYSIHDVASEIAFMAMDLEFLGFPEFAQLFVEKYVKLTGHKEMIETGLLNFYKAHRAWVRGKIEAWQGNHEKARKYFSLAESYSQLL
jgi:hypothetical protein